MYVNVYIWYRKDHKLRIPQRWRDKNDIVGPLPSQLIYNVYSGNPEVRKMAETNAVFLKLQFRIVFTDEFFINKFII